MRVFLVVICLMALLTGTAHGQTSKAAKMSRRPKADTIITDTYLGYMHSGSKTTNSAKLYLHHCRFCDDGTFKMYEVQGKAIHDTLAGGDWTVLRGSAKDENATVVELDGKGTTFYYLRHKNGDLQQLDSLLREIKPIKNHMLLKQ